MQIWTVAVFVVSCLGATRAQFMCPMEAPLSYIVDVSTDCQVYHFCEDAELKTLICPVGKAFDPLSSTCEPAETVPCSEVPPELGSGNEIPEANTSLVVPDQHVRNKRGAAFWNIAYYVASPMIKYLVRSKARIIFGTDCTVTSRIILPTIFEMLDIPSSRSDLFQVFLTAETAFLPIKMDILAQRGGLFALPGTVVQVPITRLEDAMYEIVYNTQPYLTRLAVNHFAAIHTRVVANLGLIKDSLDKLIAAKYVYARELKSVTLKFAYKHKSMVKKSTPEYLKMYSMQEILNDFVPVGRVYLKIAIEYLRRFPNSIVNVFERGQLPFLRWAPVNYPVRRQYGRGRRWQYFMG